MGVVRLSLFLAALGISVASFAYPKCPTTLARLGKIFESTSEHDPERIEPPEGRRHRRWEELLAWDRFVRVGGVPGVVVGRVRDGSAAVLRSAPLLVDRWSLENFHHYDARPEPGTWVANDGLRGAVAFVSESYRRVVETVFRNPAEVSFADVPGGLRKGWTATLRGDAWVLRHPEHPDLAVGMLPLFWSGKVEVASLVIPTRRALDVVTLSGTLAAADAIVVTVVKDAEGRMWLRDLRPLLQDGILRTRERALRVLAGEFALIPNETEISRSELRRRAEASFDEQFPKRSFPSDLDARMNEVFPYYLASVPLAGVATTVAYFMLSPELNAFFAGVAPLSGALLSYAAYGAHRQLAYWTANGRREQFRARWIDERVQSTLNAIDQETRERAGSVWRAPQARALQADDRRARRQDFEAPTATRWSPSVSSFREYLDRHAGAMTGHELTQIRHVLRAAERARLDEAAQQSFLRQLEGNGWDYANAAAAGRRWLATSSDEPRFRPLSFLRWAAPGGSLRR